MTCSASVLFYVVESTRNQLTVTAAVKAKFIAVVLDISGSMAEEGKTQNAKVTKADHISGYLNSRWP